MPLQLIVEDGSNVDGANSYATLDQIKAAALQRGVTLPTTDDAIISLSSAAMDYLGTFETRFTGVRTYGLAQGLSWPRCANNRWGTPCPLRVFGSTLAVNVIPQLVIAAQCYLVGIATDVDLYGNQDTLNITKEVIGPIETDYSAVAGAAAGPIVPVVSAMLKPLFKTGVGPLTSTRV